MELKSLFPARYVKGGVWDKTLGICGNQFVVYPYQRGYRWGKSAINKLLKDIDSYINNVLDSFPLLLRYIETFQTKMDKTESYDFYCLQALTIKSIGTGKYELIDGQQRLTSVFLLLEILDIFLNDPSDRSQIPYHILYKRGNSPEFNLTETIHKAIPTDFNGRIAKTAYKMERGDHSRKEWFEGYSDSIRKAIMDIQTLGRADAGESIVLDVYYMSEVAATIVEFIEDFEDRSGNTANLEQYRNFILQDILFLWYEIPDEVSGEDEFVGINTNKIDLTNAELIKALVLKNSDGESLPENAGNRWEAIEQGLCNPELWGFISGEEKATRIDLILDIYAKRNQFNPSREDYLSGDTKTELYDWYESYSSRFDSPKKFSDEVLRGIENIYQRISEWYDDVDIYHYVGILTSHYKRLSDYKTVESLIKNLFSIYDSSRSKTEFVGQLKQKIREFILHGVRENDRPSRLEDIVDNDLFSYQESSQYANIVCILWLLNAWETIESADNNEEVEGKRVRKQTVMRRLPFSKISNITNKRETWTLEHIMPQNPEKAGNDKDKYENLLSEIKGDNADSKIVDETEIHTIGNLALLRHGDNSAFSNENLETKRRELVQKELGEGSFIPCSTENVFNLYYNLLKEPILDDIDKKYWTKTNKENYEDRIKTCLSNFN